MKTRVALLMLLAMAGCGSGERAGEQGGAVTADAGRAAGGDAVAGVLQTQGKPIASLSFMLAARPAAGAAGTVRLDLAAPEPVAVLLVTAEAEGLTFDPGSATGSVALPGNNAVTSHELHFTAQREGLTEILVRLRNAEAESVETVYAIPVLVAPAATGG